MVNILDMLDLIKRQVETGEVDEILQAFDVGYQIIVEI